MRDASHQLRTPLAVLKAQVQSAQRGDVDAATALAEIGLLAPSALGAISVEAMGRVAGKLNALPVSYTARVLLWNTATFQKAGLALPRIAFVLLAACVVIEALGWLAGNAHVDEPPPASTASDQAPYCSGSPHEAITPGRCVPRKATWKPQTKKPVASSR